MKKFCTIHKRNHVSIYNTIKHSGIACGSSDHSQFRTPFLEQIRILSSRGLRRNNTRVFRHFSISNFNRLQFHGSIRKRHHKRLYLIYSINYRIFRYSNLVSSFTNFTLANVKSFKIISSFFWSFGQSVFSPLYQYNTI